MPARRFRILLMTAFTAFAAQANAECGIVSSGSAAKDCLAQDLRDSDKRINAVYGLLMKAADEADKNTLRTDQRAWLKKRAKVCGINDKEPDREKWLNAILADDEETACVVRFTYARVAELNVQLKNQAGASAAEEQKTAALPAAPQAPNLVATPSSPASVSLPDGVTFNQDGYQAFSTRSHATGKWYFELWIDSGHIADLGNVLLIPGVKGPDGHGVVKTFSIRHVHDGGLFKSGDTRTGGAPVTLSWAIDLDNGSASSRVDGVWEAEPGSNSALVLKLNQSYRVVIESSSPLDELIKRGFVKLNLGDQPFKYSLPDGYRPFSEN